MQIVAEQALTVLDLLNQEHPDTSLAHMDPQALAKFLVSTAHKCTW